MLLKIIVEQNWIFILWHKFLIVICKHSMQTFMHALIIKTVNDEPDEFKY